MIINRLISFFFLLLMATTVVAQQLPDKKKLKEKLNQYDGKGLKDGLWLNRMPERKGEAGYNEFGNYNKGEKTGLWYKMDAEGDLMAIENYKRDSYDGQVKYFTNGQLTVVGMYRALNPDVVVDTIMVIEPVTGMQELVAVKADRGTVRHGTWRFYDQRTGRLEKVEEYQVDNLIYEEYFPMSKADSLYYEKRNANLPHIKKGSDKPQRKMHSYLN
ncbi:MAG TPA: hypothetical protein VIN07_15030 [Flavipsychrobacter sp.]